ncbi:MAG: PEP-utilizing enzyme [Mycobacterium sp.]|uniref:PEP-utilizing enzyme n=1 Tax=Mycobacterium sp. TaxID=1785 RepID=UPI0026096332|nr:PEP-utilizing enzyme [Mycobacterium sp.]MDI3315430.1 PEP-utilizing enzyme [Mycobacterium sp.]
MRVVVTGTPGDVASCVVSELARRGNEVRHDRHGTGAPPGRLGCDALVVVAAAAGGNRDRVASARAEAAPARAVLDAAERVAAPRIVVILPSPGHPPITEGRLCAWDLLRRIEKSGVSLLVARTAPALGRDTTGAVQRRFGAPIVVGMAGSRNTVQFIHHDDLARFVAEAVEHPRWTGHLDVANADALELREVADILGKPYVELDAARWTRGARRWKTSLWAPADPPLDTTRLAELGFVPAWTSRDCVADFRLANRAHVFLGARKVALPWRFPWTRTPPPRRDGCSRHPANDSGGGGEFDTTVDPRWPEFTCANIAEAFPGPMTPLSLELAMEAMRATGVLAARIMQLTGDIRRAMTEEHVGCFGHSIYVNLTVSRVVSALLPGAEPTAWRDLLFGAASGVDAAAPRKARAWDLARRLPKIGVLLGVTGRETRRMESEARERQRDGGYYSCRTDDELYSQLRCMRDAVANSWAVAALGSAGVVPIMALIGRQGGTRVASRLKAGADNLASAGLMRGAYQLAGHARADPAIAAILRETDSGKALHCLRLNHPEYAARVDAVIAEYGHRGPNETELSSPVFADTPARLLDVVAKLIDLPERPATPAPSMAPKMRLLTRLGAEFQRSRERARDAAMRYTHNYRLIVRELGARLAARGIIEQPDDVFYLIRDELTHPPADIRSRIARRKAERTRLERLRPPVYFVQRWQPRCDTTAELKPGQSLTGIPVSAGLARGRVRVLTADSIEDLQPGEVLVAEATDTGWTPYFSYAAAVVVDIGAEMSHAAVVAREFSIPCVVGSITASRMLRTGQLIEVDGSTGRVTRMR